MAASGAAFTTVVLAQLANAFACRSASADWLYKIARHRRAGTATTATKVQRL